MKDLMAGAIASLMAAGAWADIRVIETEFEFDGPGSTYDMVVENSSDQSIARLEYQSVYKTPGRAVPWAEKSGGLDIPGGIDPGETKRLEYIMAPFELVHSEGHGVIVEVHDVVGLDINGSPIE